MDTGTILTSAVGLYLLMTNRGSTDPPGSTTIVFTSPTPNTTIHVTSFPANVIVTGVSTAAGTFSILVALERGNTVITPLKLALGITNWSTVFTLSIAATNYTIRAQERDIAGNVLGEKLLTFQIVDDVISGSGKAVGWYIPGYSTAQLQKALEMAIKWNKVPFLVAINPASGPGDQYVGTGVNTTTRDLTAQLAIRPNVTVIGYTGTWYAKAVENPPVGSQWGGSHLNVIYTVDRAQTAAHLAAGRKSICLLDNVDNYLSRYPGVKGLMCDEQYTGTDAAKVAFYQTLKTYAKSKGMTYFKGNPGTSVSTIWFTNGIFENESITEGSGIPTVSTLQGSTGVYARKKSFTRHTIPATSINQSLISSLAPNVALMYMTDDSGGNQYDNPPSYIDQMSQYLDTYNKSVGAYT